MSLQPCLRIAKKVSLFLIQAEEPNVGLRAPRRTVVRRAKHGVLGKISLWARRSGKAV